MTVKWWLPEGKREWVGGVVEGITLIVVEHWSFGGGWVGERKRVGRREGERGKVHESEKCEAAIQNFYNIVNQVHINWKIKQRQI